MADDPHDVAPPPGNEPPAEGDAPIAVTPALLTAFLALRTTQARIRQVVVARARGRIQSADVDALVSDVNHKILTATSLPKSVDAMRPWVSRIAQNATIDVLRQGEKEPEGVRVDIDVDELVPDPVDTPDDAVTLDEVDAMGATMHDLAPRKDERWTLGPWIRFEIGRRPEPHRSRDGQILEMLDYSAKNPKLADAALAATFGLTRDQYKHRLAQFKARYVPRRRQYVRRRNFVLFLLVAAAVIAVVYRLLFPAFPAQPIERDPDTKPLLRPNPSASAPPAPPPKPTFNQALPPPEPTDESKPK